MVVEMDASKVALKVAGRVELRAGALDPSLAGELVESTVARRVVSTAE